MPINVTEIEEPKNKTCEDIWNLIAASVFYEYYAIKISFLLQSNTPVSEDASRCWMHNPHYKVNTEESCYISLKDFWQLDVNWWRRYLKKGEKKQFWQLKYCVHFVWEKNFAEYSRDWSL